MTADTLSPFLLKVYKTNMIGKTESLDKEITQSPCTCIYVWYEPLVINSRKSTTLRQAMSLMAAENPDLIPRSVSMSIKSVFVRPSSGKLAHKDLGMVFNFKVSKEESKTLEELGLNIGDFLWVNTVKGYPQKSIIGSSKAVPRAEVLNKTIQSKDFGIVNRARATPYERSGQDRMEFRSNRSRGSNRVFRSRNERQTNNDRRHVDKMDDVEKSDHPVNEEADVKMDNDASVSQKEESKEKDGW